MTNGKKPIEAFALSRVPREQRKSWIDMVMVQAGMVICIPAFLLGSMLAEGMPTLQAILAGIIGYGMVLVLTLILGIQGADLGIPTCAISTSTFGRKGTRLLVSSLFTVSLVGFFGLQVNVCGEAFSTLALAAFGVQIPVVVFSIFWGMVMVVIAVWGMETLKNLDTISVPLLLLIMIVGTVMAFRIYGSAGLSANEVETPTMTMIGLPILGLTIMILAQLTTNSVNAYTGGLDAVMTFNLPDNRRREATFVVGVLGVVLAVLGILDFIEVYLNWTTFLGAPIAGVMIADYWIVGKGKPASWHANEGWNGTGIAATLISLVIALMIPFGVFNFNGVIIGFIVYLILEHFWPSESRNN